MTTSAIRDLFAKPVDRPIEGVIKADDERNLDVELVEDEIKTFLSRHADDLADLPGPEVVVLKRAAENPAPFRGSLLPDAKAVMPKLQEALAQQLGTARKDALAEIAEQEHRLRAAAVFQQLNSDQQQELLSTPERVKQELAALDQPSRLQARVQRFHTVEMPTLWSRATTLATPPEERAKPIKVIPAVSLKHQCPLGQITNATELEQWLAALRAAVQAELDQGHRISL